MKIWNSKKSDKSEKKDVREALFSKEIADDLMAQIAGGQNKSGCHALLEA
ncbi:MAG TPA: hypothetical protein VER04_26520 [Polyangiaceae bacterium]|jgi:hypothetical protein|nr:hypothetical protein [Polyangiaceae bacterium]